MLTNVCRYRPSPRPRHKTFDTPENSCMPLVQVIWIPSLHRAATSVHYSLLLPITDLCRNNYTVFCIWFILLNITLLRFISAIAYINRPFFWCVVFHCLTISYYPSSCGWEFDCPQFSAVRNQVAINIHFSWAYLRMKLLNRRVGVRLTLLDTAK